MNEQTTVHSLIHPGYFYTAISNLLLLKSTPDTARILLGRDGALVESITFNQVVGSTPALAIT